jgi:hypothetical protein
VHDGVDAAQGVAEREMVREVAHRDLDADAILVESAGIPNEAANRRTAGGQPPQERPSDRSGGACQQQHCAEATGRLSD